MASSTNLLTEVDLLDQIAMFQRKLKGLTAAEPGAGMATAAASVRLQRLQDEARSRGLEL